jgi:hypothetical protein
MRYACVLMLAVIGLGCQQAAPPAGPAPVIVRPLILPARPWYDPYHPHDPYHPR